MKRIGDVIKDRVMKYLIGKYRYDPEAESHPISGESEDGYLWYLRRVESNPSCYWWNGYVSVEEGHPWHGKSADEIESSSAHGGITYAGYLEGGPHFYVGFDTAHSGDFWPSEHDDLPEGVIPWDMDRLYQALYLLAMEAHMVQVNHVKQVEAHGTN